MTDRSQRRWRRLPPGVVATVALIVLALAAASVLHRSARSALAPTGSGSTPATAGAASGATTAAPGPTTPAASAATQPTTPATPIAFPSASCQPAAMAGDGELGLGIPRPARLASAGPERTAFESAVGCLSAVSGRPLILRTQLPIDVTRRTAVPDDENAELLAFAALLTTDHASGIVSIRAHDFTVCGAPGRPRAEQVSRLRIGQALQPCQFPSPSLYAQLFTELQAALSQAAPNIALRYSAWNEPDHPSFTLQAAFGAKGAAKRAGEYWMKAAAVVGADHMLAGEFADRDLPRLLALRDAFIKGAQTAAPPAWALHPYRDLTSDGPNVANGFSEAVAPAPVWLTEVTPRLSGRDGIGGNAGLQRARGEQLRSELGQAPMRVVLYLLTPPPAPTNSTADHWDSALADRQGRARPFICGLAGLPEADCTGDPNPYGG